MVQLSCVFDVKDCFLSGSHDELTADVVKLLPERDRRPTEVLLKTLLTTQHVSHYGDDEHLWRVRRGTGMGLLCSSDVADAALYSRMERNFFDNEEVKRKLGIVMYARYRDDGVVATDKPWLIDKIISMMNVKAGYFKLEYETRITRPIDFLDVTIWKGSRFRKSRLLDHKVYTKPTSIYTPLGISSLHVPSIHLTWPRAMIRRFRDRCYHDADFVS